MTTIDQTITTVDRATIESAGIPISTASETETRDTFHALMWALSYPGRIYTLPALSHSPLHDEIAPPLQPFVAVAHTLLDLEVSYFTPVVALDQLLSNTSARRATAAAADYHFYPYLNFFDADEHLAYMRQAKTGTMLYPDQSATLVVACQLGDGDHLRLTGPGIQTENELSVTGIPSMFWTLRAEMIAYPLGIDLILVDGQQVAGLPRTTAIT